MGINFVKRMAQIFAMHNYKTEILPSDFSTVRSSPLPGEDAKCSLGLVFHDFDRFV